MSQRFDGAQPYYPSLSMAACQGSGEGTDGGGYGVARQPAVPVPQDPPDERTRRFVQDQDGGPCLSVSITTQHHQGWPSDANNDIELESSNSFGLPLCQSRNPSSQNNSPRTAYRQVKQRLGVMRTARPAHRSDAGSVEYPTMTTCQRQRVYNAGGNSDRSAPNCSKQHRHQGRYFEPGQFERDGAGTLLRYDGGQAYQATNPLGGHQDGSGGGLTPSQFDDSEDSLPSTEGDAKNRPERD